jgi:hypothetical protein
MKPSCGDLSLQDNDENCYMGSLPPSHPPASPQDVFGSAFLEFRGIRIFNGIVLILHNSAYFLLNNTAKFCGIPYWFVYIEFLLSSNENSLTCNKTNEKYKRNATESRKDL